MKKKFTFIAVNYNNASYTIKFINSIKRLQSQERTIKIIIVDNNSDFQDFKQIETAIEGNGTITLIRNTVNVGYFRALNIGLDQINQKKDGFIIIGNNDLEFEDSFIEKLEKISYDKQTFALSPNIITPNGYHQNPHCIHKVSTLRKLGYKIYFTNYYLGQLIYWMTQKYKRFRYANITNEHNEQFFIYMGIGACYILTEHFFDHYLRLDNRVFLWGEEALFARQLEKKGGKILYDPSLIVYHNENTSVKKMPSKRSYQIQKESFKIYSKYL